VSTTAKREAKVPRPELPETAVYFELAWYFRKLTEREALDECRTKAHRLRNQAKANTLIFALTGAIINIDDKIKEAVENLRADGQLLLAWAGTTAFAAKVAA